MIFGPNLAPTWANLASNWGSFWVHAGWVRQAFVPKPPPDPPKTLPRHPTSPQDTPHYNKRQWGILTFAGSWGHLGPKRAPRAKNSSKTRFALPPWTPQVGPKNRQKSILRPSKSDHFFDDLLGGVLMPFGANLVPT